ncbi:MAG: hypothetical protein WBQ34_00145 [Candidatus Acidiferrales bacterium]
MFKRFRRLLVESYIGAIALGIVLADAIRAFTDIFVAPISGWAVETRLQRALPNAPRGLQLNLSLPYLEECVLLILVWYLLLLWLYSKPLDTSTLAESPAESSQGT